MAILVLALMTASIVASFSATSAEIVANNAMRAQDHAYQFAETGLQQFLVRRGEPGFCSHCVIDPTVADSEWTRVNLTGGYANVVAMRIRPKLSDAVPALFLIRSTGVDSTVKLSGAGHMVFATRTIGHYATFGTSGIKAIGAMTSLQGFFNNVGGSRIPSAGADKCGMAPALAGLVVPAGGQYHGGGTQPTGTPRVDSSMTLDSLKQRIGIDWNAIIKLDAIPADITIPPDGNFPSAAAFADTSYWPVIRIKKDFTIPRDGRGLVIADSNLSFTSNRTWDGIVLVGGSLYSTGNDTTEGVAISGLNRTLPGATNPANNTSSDDDLLSNSKHFAYNSCKAARAAERLRIYFAWSNTWMDNVAMW
jgi:hypothetical protein